MPIILLVRLRYLDGQTALPGFDFPFGNILVVCEIDQGDVCLIAGIQNISDVETITIHRLNGAFCGVNLATHLLEKRNDLPYAPECTRSF
jgi:hypothetical protein